MERRETGLQGSALAPLEQGDTSSSKRRREKGGRDIDESIREKNARAQVWIWDLPMCFNNTLLPHDCT